MRTVNVFSTAAVMCGSHDAVQQMGIRLMITMMAAGFGEGGKGSSRTVSLREPHVPRSHRAER